MTTDSILNKLLRDANETFADWEKVIIYEAMERYAKYHASLAFDAGALYRSVYEELNEDGSFPKYPDDAPDKETFLKQTFGEDIVNK